MGQVRPKSELNQSPDGAVSQALRRAFPFLSGDDRSEALAQRVSSFSCGLGSSAPRLLAAHGPWNRVLFGWTWSAVYAESCVGCGVVVDKTIVWACA